MTGAPIEEQGEVTLFDYIGLLRRRKAILLQTVVAVLVIGAVVTFLTKPVYRATTRILVEGKALNLAQYNADDPLSNLFVPPAGHDVDTQIEVLNGDRLLSDAFSAARVPYDPTTHSTPPGSPPMHIGVRQVGSTDVIEIAVESTSPQYAERLARAIPPTYLTYVSGDRKTEVTKALTFAEGQLHDDNQKLVLAEIALERFKKQARVADVETERNERIKAENEAEADERKAAAEVAGARARLDVLAAARKALPALITVPSSTSNLVEISAERDKLAELRTERAKLLVLYKAGHPEVQQVDAEIAVVTQRLASAPKMVTTVTRTQNPAVAAYDDRITEAQGAVTAAQAAYEDTHARTSHLAATIGNYSSVERHQAALQRDVEQDQNLDNMLTKSVEDLSLRAQATHDPVLTITPAAEAQQVAPRKLTNLLVAGIVGLILGFCLALVQDLLDDRINEPDDLRTVADIPAIGFVPMIKAPDPLLLTGAITSGAVGESYRVIRSNIQFANVDSRYQSILITSSMAGEGKSLTACNLAAAMALDGYRVIIVDCDLRRPTLHEKFRIERQPGLTNVLLKQATIDEALHESGIPGLRVLTAGALPPNPAEVLNSGAMRDVHACLRELADIVIFDSPPCLATADAQVLAGAVDGVLYVVEVGEARKPALRHAFDLLRRAHANMLGVVFNKVERTTSGQSGYYYGYYYHHYYERAQLAEGQNGATDTQFQALVRKNGSHAHAGAPNGNHVRKEA